MSRRGLLGHVDDFRAALRAPGAVDEARAIRDAWTNLGVAWTFATRAERYAAADDFRAAAREFDAFACRERAAVATT